MGATRPSRRSRCRPRRCNQERLTNLPLIDYKDELNPKFQYRMTKTGLDFRIHVTLIFPELE